MKKPQKWNLVFLVLVFFHFTMHSQSADSFINNSLRVLSKGEYDERYKRVRYYYWSSEKSYYDVLESYYVPKILRDSVLEKQYYKVINDKYSEDSLSFLELSQSITQKSKELRIHFNVTFKTQKDSATIKYQTIWERANRKSASQANQLTNNCNENLPIGYYYIWSERKGKVTSDMERKVYVHEKKTIDIVEDN